MKVDALDRACQLVEADVVKSLKTRATYCPHSVVWNQEVFLPAHEQMLLVHPVFRH